MTVPIKTIAMLANAIHNVQCTYGEVILGEKKKPWDTLSNEEQSKIIGWVSRYLNSKPKLPDEVHVEWMNDKEKDGWKYAPEYNEENKEHPCMVPYEELPPAQKLKDHLIVDILTPFFKG